MDKKVAPLAERRRRSMQKSYDPKPITDRLTALMDAQKLSYRETALGAGLHHQSVRRIVVEGKRPNMIECILLADFFGLNPNELLEASAWPTLKAFELHGRSAENLPPEAVEVAMDIGKIDDPFTRKQVTDAIRVLLKKYF